MKPVSLAEISEVLEGPLTGTEGSEVVHRAVTDSRSACDGDLFFALKGRTDGADFAPEAHLRGAVAAVATRPLSVPTLIVEEPLEAMQKLARWSLSQADSPLVVGITGSVGKTTCKDALSAILRSAGRKVSATEGNFNNEIGLPLTVLAAEPTTEVLVLEMGATHPGDIEYLCGIAPPQVGVLTAVSPVHLEFFGSLEGLAATKGELAMSLPETGSMVYPASAPEAATGRGRELGRRISFGREGEANLWVSDVEELEEGLRFVIHFEDESAQVRSAVFGTHLVEPLMAAFGGAISLGLSLEECARGVSRLRRSGRRGDVYRLRDDIVVYDDSYNASPAAVAAVLRYCAQQSRQQGRRFVAVLGGMFELGHTARAYHQETGRLAQEVGTDVLVCVGEEARWYAEGFAGETILYEDAETAGDHLNEILRPGDYVAVKGSLGVGLDAVTRKLKESLALV